MPLVGGSISGELTYVDVTLSLDTSAYASGDVLAAPQEVALAVLSDAGCGVVESIVVIDKDDQGQALDLVFMTATGSLGAENATVGPTDAVAATICGIVPVLASDYKDLTNSQLATLTNVGLAVKAPSGTSLYVGAVCRGGTPTYTASGIVLRIGIIQL